MWKAKKAFYQDKLTVDIYEQGDMADFVSPVFSLLSFRANSVKSKDKLRASEGS